MLKVLALPIEMIAWFNEGGLPTPIKFKINSESMANVVKVDKIIHREVEKFAGNHVYLFRCLSVVDNTERLYELKYELKSCKWMLFKM